jgi:hypothetical protein
MLPVEKIFSEKFQKIRNRNNFVTCQSFGFVVSEQKQI